MRAPIRNSGAAGAGTFVMVQHGSGVPRSADGSETAGWP
jgi:hypothetical protein